MKHKNLLLLPYVVQVTLSNRENPWHDEIMRLTDILAVISRDTSSNE